MNEPIKPSVAIKIRLKKQDARVKALENALCWVRDQLTSSDSPDCPDHGHEKRGRWDSDGSRCEECAEWKKVWALIKHIQ